MIFYQGPSMLDSAPIVGILTGYKGKGSANGKTGRMLQTWILRSDIHPAVAAKNGSDFSICGSCIHRASSAKTRTCYVRVEQAPTAVWKAYQRGSYIPVSPKVVGLHIAGHKIRLGSYGDPVAIPKSVWLNMLRYTAGHTGYTHQWGTELGQWARGILQASVDSEAEYKQASALDWRCFYVYNPKLQLPSASSLGVCPSSEEYKASGKPAVSCSSCMKCNGAKSDIKIQAHGIAKYRVGLAMV